MIMKYMDCTLSIEERLDDLLNRMTIEEKIGQLVQPLAWDAYVKTDGRVEVSDRFKQILLRGGVGSLYGVLRADSWTGITIETGLNAVQGVEAVNAIQRYAVEKTRLGIPLLFCGECAHGHMAIGATVFPVQIGMASAWNPQLLNEVLKAASLECRRQGNRVTYSPVLDVARDPRWGRTEESFGEDAYLCSRMATACVEAHQGNGLDNEDTVLMTAKHFAAHGIPEGGHNSAPSRVGPRELKDIHLRPFEAAVRAGVQVVMTAYSEIDGIPCSVNRYLLTEVLRKEWGFEGITVSDCGALSMLSKDYRIAADDAEAAAMALKAGVDIDLPGDIYGNNLLRALEKKLITREDIDLAAGRVLRLKLRMGLFERPYVDAAKVQEIFGCRKHRSLARKAAEQSVILLKNKDGVLPLKKDGKTVAVIGPNADHIYNQLGDYTAPQRREDIVTVLDAVKRKVLPDTVVAYARGCAVRDGSKEGFPEAIALAKKSDVVIAVMGGSSARQYGEENVDGKTGAAKLSDTDILNDMECGEGFDRAELGLAGVQLDLLKELHATGVKLVVVLIKGRPLGIPWLEEHADAILDAWYPGQEGGNAIADILFGDCCPSGKLPVTVPKAVGQLPVCYNTRISKDRGYVEMDNRPLYYFGYGLSYTTFRYDNLKLDKKQLSSWDTLGVSIEVTNTGSREGDEIVQLYLRDEVSSVARPWKELKGFERIHLRPGETKEVRFQITGEEMKFAGMDGRFVIEPGYFTVMVGGNSETGLSAGYELQ